MEKKMCNKCKIEKQVSDFTKNKQKKSGYNYYCKECNKSYQKEHYKANKADYIDKKNNRKKSLKEFVVSIKDVAKCYRCHEGDIACLDFHHINNNDKDFNIALAVNHGVSIETLKKEIDKCIILCSNCHRKLHYYQ